MQWLKTLLVAAVVLYSTAAYAGSVSMSWPPDTTGKVDGYRLYYGNTSRYDASILPDIEDHINTMCKTQKCVDSWDKYCVWNAEKLGADDPYKDYRICDADYFDYDYSTDVGNVTEWTVDDLDDGTWFFTIVSYDNEATYAFYAGSPPESTFSEELMEVLETSVPPEPEIEPGPPKMPVPPEIEPGPPKMPVPPVPPKPVPMPEPTPVEPTPEPEDPTWDDMPNNNTDPEPEDITNSSGGGGGGCFITSLGR